MSVCEIDGCDKPVKARGWCGKHWSRWRRHGDTSAVKKPGPKSRCAADGCDRDASRHGLCGAHSERLRRFGDPVAWVPIGASRGELLEALNPPEVPEECVDCGAEPYCDGALRCHPCMLADLARLRTARNPFGQSTASPDPARTAVRQARIPVFARKGAA